MPEVIDISQLTYYPSLQLFWGPEELRYPNAWAIGVKGTKETVIFNRIEGHWKKTVNDLIKVSGHGYENIFLYSALHDLKSYRLLLSRIRLNEPSFFH